MLRIPLLQQKMIAVAIGSLLLGACHSTTPINGEGVLFDEGKRYVTLEQLDRDGEPRDVDRVDGLPQSEVMAQVDLEKSGGFPQVPEVRDRILQPVKIEGEDMVQFDYDQIDLRQVLEEIADILGISLLIDSSIADKVTLRTAPDRPLKRADLWPLLRLLLNEAGVSLEKKGPIYHARKSAVGLPTDFGGSQIALDNASGHAMQIVSLRNVDLNAALMVLKPMVEPTGGRIIALNGLNMIGVVSTTEQLIRVNQLIELIDVDAFAHRGFRLYPLKRAKAEEVAQDLKSVIGLLDGETSTYQVLGLSRINSVLVVSPPGRGFAEIDRWLSILDAGEGDSVERIFIYRVKNLDAKGLASTLSEVFKNDDKVAVNTTKEEKKEEEKKGLAEAVAEQQQQEAANQSTQADSTRSQELAAPTSASIQVNIVADESTNSLLVRAAPRDYRQLLETIAELDRVPKEVMINVVIAEVTLNENNRFGIEWKAINEVASKTLEAVGSAGAEAVGEAISAVGLATTSVIDKTLSTTFGLEGSTMTGLVFNRTTDRLNLLLNLLDRDSDLKVLSRPSILVRNKEEAVIKIGSEEPVLSRVSTTDNNTTTSPVYNDVQYRDTGIILTVTPQINDDGVINIKVEQEISQVGEQNGVLGLPAFTNREIKTSAVLRNGQPLILGGIIQDRIESNSVGVPVLKDIPGVGALFSDQSEGVERTELVLIMIPELVNPMDDNPLPVERLYHRLTGVASLLEDRGVAFELGMPTLNNRSSNIQEIGN